MLDFYLLKDDEPRSNSPEHAGLQFAGSLDEKTFFNLKAKKVVTDNFDYYSDFRWGTTTVLQIRQSIIERQMSDDSDVKKVMVLLEIAEKNSSGLMAYSD